MATKLKRRISKLALSGLLFLSLQGIFIVNPPVLDSANLTAVKDTLSTSRLSYYGTLAAGNSVDSTIVQIKTSGPPSTSSANLFTGDSVWIGDGATGTNYTVDDVLDTDEFQITAGLGSGDSDENDLVIATRSATHNLAFTTASAISNGAIRILIPSGTDNNTDGIPNHDGFDFNGMTASDITAPTGGGVTSWDTTDAPTATASGGANCDAGNHCFEARYNGTNSVSTALTFTIGDTNKLANPAKSGTTEGSADTYTVTVQHLGSMTDGYPVVDSTTIKIAVVESVRVTATVEPTINFTIAGVASGLDRCGGTATTDVTTTATTVPLGALSIDAFTDAAQNLKVSTNADGGYVVTSLENDQLGKDGGTSPYIPDTPGDGSLATHLVWDKWDSTSTNGFGYSLMNNDAFDVTFTYATSSGGCNGNFCTKQFADNTNSEAANQIFYSNTVAENEDVDICYRAVISAIQEAGDYENNITYTATATF